MDDNQTISKSEKDNEILKRKIRFKFWILDIVTIVTSYLLAYVIRNNIGTGLDYSDNYLFLLLLMIPTFFILIRRSNFTHIREKVNFGFILINFFQLCFFGLLIIFSFLFIFKMKDISRAFILIFFIIYMVTLSLLQVYRSQSYRNQRKNSEPN